MKTILQFIRFATLGLVLTLASCGSPELRPAPLTLRSAKPGTEVAFQQRAGDCIADVRCPGGIGWAQFTLAQNVRPKNIVFRLHLRGLEEANVSCAGATTHISVSSHGDATIREWRENGQPVATVDQVLILLVSHDGGKPQIPLAGWFEIRLPQSFVAGGAVRLSWIDFYR